MPQPEKYKQPFVESGMFVQWLPEPGHKTGLASLVTEVGADGISVLAFPPNTNGGRVISGIRNENDPSMAIEWIRKQGCWRHLKTTEILIELMTSASPRA